MAALCSSPREKILVGLVLALMTGVMCYRVYSPRWFYWHPFSMIVGFIFLSGTGIIFERNAYWHYTHLSLQVIATVLSFFGWYVIWSNKETFGKKHLMTWHSWIGTAALLMCGFQAGGGMWGQWPTDVKRKEWAYSHRFLGRLTYLAAQAAIFTGWNYMRGRYPYDVPVFVLAEAFVLFSLFVPFPRKIFTRKKPPSKQPLANKTE